MAKFYKEKSFEFQLANYDCEREFTIWKVYGHTADVINPDTKEPYSFPIRVGSDLKGTDGQIRQVGDTLLFMKLPEFQKLYPNMAKSTRYVRQVIVKGELFLYRFSKSSNDEIEKNIAILKGVGKDPLHVMFKQDFDKRRAPREMYRILVVGQGQERSPAHSNVAVNTNAIDVPKSQGLLLDEKEQAVYNAIINLSITVPKEKFIKVLSDNKIATARAEQIYTQLYEKRESK